MDDPQPASIDFMVRPAQSRELPQVVEVHQASFPGFFLTFLGPRFLRLLYDSILTDAEGALLVAVGNAGRVEGFVAGVTRQDGFYLRLVKKRAWAFAAAASGAVLRHPRIGPRLWRALRRPDEARQAAAAACLMSIAVRPESAGRGIGRQLVEGFGDEMDRRGVRAFCLTTDRDDNDRVNQFYQRMGFNLAQTFTTPEGRVMNEYVIALPLP